MRSCVKLRRERHADRKGVSIIATLVCLVATAIAASFAPALPAQKTTPAALSPEQWRADLRVFAEELPRLHTNLFHTMTQEQFDEAVRRLDRRIPSMLDHEIVVEFMRITALVGDGHTQVRNIRSRFRPERYPLQLYPFRDGLFVRRAAEPHQDLAGAKVVRLGSVSAEEALRQLAEVASHDNLMGVMEDAPFFFALPEVLHALGITRDLQSLALELEIEGRIRTVVVKSIAPPLAGVVDARAAASTPTPLWLSRPREHNWFEHLPEQRTLYVMYDRVQDQPDETVAAFFERVFRFAAAHPVDKLVLDVRTNGGGNNFLNRPIIRGVIRSEFDEPGRFFVIIGRGTFSAAQNLVNALERYTDAIFVGEPTGSRPNTYGDARPLTLPNSGLVVRASTIWHQDSHPLDQREWTAPHVAAEMTGAEYRANRDPAMEAILGYRPQPTIGELVESAADDLVTFVAAYRAFRSAPRNRYVDTEAALRSLGERLLGSGRPDDAVTVLTLNAEAYPSSANTFRSLAEAYTIQGKPNEAIRCHERVLEIEPNDANSTEALRSLRQP